MSESTQEPSSAIHYEYEPTEADAVFEGGGVKGIGLVGALAACEERGYHWKNVAGTSAGAITAALVAAGYTAKEIKNELDRFMREPAPDGSCGYERFRDKGYVDHIPLLGPMLSIGFERGIYEGECLESWLYDLLAQKNVYTFADLVNPDKKDTAKTDPMHYRLRVIASDLTRHRLLELPQAMSDYEEYGGDPDKLNVARSVRMSMSIPFFFEPVELTCQDKNFPRTELEQAWELREGRSAFPLDRQRRCYVVDGGLLSNFPVDLYDVPPGVLPRRPTLGFKLVAPADDKPARIGGPFSLFAALFTTMMEAHDQRHMDAGAEVRTIRIRTGKVKTTDFDLSQQASDELYQRGRDGAERFFERWEALGGFNGYVEKYRRV